MREKKIIEGVVVPKRYQDKRRAEKQIRDLKKKEEQAIRRVKSNALRIPFRIDENYVPTEKTRNIVCKSIVVEIKENKLFDDKYIHLVEMIGGKKNMEVYIQWFKSKSKTKEQLISLHLRDIKKIIENQIKNDKYNNTK